MDKSRIKEILIKARSEYGREKQREKSIFKAYSRLKKRAKREGEGELFDNFYLVEEAYSSAISLYSPSITLLMASPSV